MSLRRAALVFVGCSLLAAVLWAPLDAQTPASGTRLLRSPTVSATHIAFAYANNIWSVERAGGVARRLTSFQGRRRIRISRRTASGSRSAASTPATSTSTSCRPKAASRSV